MHCSTTLVPFAGQRVNHSALKRRFPAIEQQRDLGHRADRVVGPRLEHSSRGLRRPTERPPRRSPRRWLRHVVRAVADIRAPLAARMPSSPAAYTSGYGSGLCTGTSSQDTTTSKNRAEAEALEALFGRPAPTSKSRPQAQTPAQAVHSRATSTPGTRAPCIVNARIVLSVRQQELLGVVLGELPHLIAQRNAHVVHEHLVGQRRSEHLRRCSSASTPGSARACR